MADGIECPTTLDVWVRKSEALHVAHYCLTTGENHLFWKIMYKNETINFRNVNGLKSS